MVADEAALRGAAPARVRDRLPDARQRRRGRGRRPGGPACACTRGSRPARRSSRRPAYLATVVTRLAIDELRSARARRETYVGEWLPEPIVTDPGCRSRRAGRARRLALAGLPGRAREPHPGAARGVPAARGLRLPLRPDRRDRRARARTPRASSPSAPGGGSSEGQPRFETSPEQEERLASRVLRRRRGRRPGVARAPARRRRRAPRRRRRQGAGASRARSVGRTRAARTLGAWSKAGGALRRVPSQRTPSTGSPGRSLERPTAG